MQRGPFGERAVCFLCDYGLIVLAVLIVAGVAAWRLNGRWPAHPLLPPVSASQTPTSTSSLPTGTPLPGVTPTIPTVTVAPSPTVPPLPEFVLVFIPVNWQSGQTHFEQVVRAQADKFVNESHMNDYFSVQVEILPEGLENVSLTNPDLDYDILEYGLAHKAGDRYVGLTDGDLAPEGNSDVAGWTSGGQAIVGEDSDVVVTAHELGHTFGLCDEYNYSEWTLQDEALTDGCPNPYPSTCPQSTTDEITCDGAPTSDGRNSIMGPSGLYGDYGFNSSCLDHLSEIFRQIVTMVYQ